MSKSVTKARIVLMQTKQNRMIPGFSFMRPRDWRSLCHRFGHQQTDPPEESGAADLLGHLDLRAAEQLTGSPRCSSEWSEHPGGIKNRRLAQY